MLRSLWPARKAILNEGEQSDQPVGPEYAQSENARAPRGRDHRPPDRRGDRRRPRRIGAGARRQRAAELRPAAVRARGSHARGGAPPRQAVPGRHRARWRRRPDGADPPDVGRAGCSCSTPARRCATAPRGCCCASTTAASCASGSSAPSRRHGSSCCAPPRSTPRRRSPSSGPRRGPSRRRLTSCSTSPGRCTR